MTYRGCFRWSLAAVAAVAGLLTGGAAADVLLPTGSAAALVTLGWAASTLRVIRLAAACPGPSGGSGPGGAGVREPRRPKPCPPDGAIALPLPEDPPGGTAALA
ncbi:hypothetical protein [Streptomyces albicerus]|uniref:hypothetical protein n=1 Tax=Streptomyces albicerus TaxID=2569859 RepID=UPI00124BAD1B|nr:hypothetical protein [Streptomyces albicerus]